MKTVEFWSSVEYGTFLSGLVRELSAHGWNAVQRFLVEEKDYRMARGFAARLRLRARTYIVYPARLRARLLREKHPAVLVVCTNTFYAPALAMAVARKKGVPVIHWVFDLYPDILIHAGKMRAGGFRDRVLGSLAAYAYRNAAANVFLGECIRRCAEERYGEISASSLIAVGADGRPFPRAPAPVGPGVPIDVLYCGNFGRLHDIDSVLRLFRGGVPDGFRFRFNASGVEMRRLSEAVRNRRDFDRVVTGGNLDAAEWTDAMRESQMALVTLKDGASGLGMPSKTYSAMVAGQAILAICPRDSDLAETVLRHDAGWVIEPGHIQALRITLRRIAENPGELDAKRRNAYDAGHAFYDQRVVAGEWSCLLNRVTGAVAREPLVQVETVGDSAAEANGCVEAT